MTRLSLPKVGDRLVMALFVPESSIANKRPSGVSVMLTATRFVKSPTLDGNHDFSMEDCDITKVACQTRTVNGTDACLDVS